MEINFSKLPSSSRIWIYSSSRKFSKNETDLIKGYCSTFLNEWTSHGKGLQAAIDIPYNHFIVIGINQMYQGLSGCSIDDSIRFIKRIEKEFNVTLLDRMMTTYKDGQKIRKTNIENFKQKINEGVIDSKTIVFNNLVNSKAEYDTIWKVQASNSWHNRFF